MLEELKEAGIVVEKICHDDCKTLSKFIDSPTRTNLIGERIVNSLDLFHCAKNLKKKIDAVFGKEATVNRVRFLEVNISALSQERRDAFIDYVDGITEKEDWDSSKYSSKKDMMTAFKAFLSSD